MRDARARKLLCLEVGRGLAAFIVVLRHLCVHAFEVPSVDIFIPLPSATAVMFFFVLSGVVLGLAHPPAPASSGRAARFLASRVLRVYPTYWLVLGLTLLRWPFLFNASRIWLWASLCLLPLSMETLIGKLVIPQAWTLHWESFFYLAFAVLIAMGRVGAGLVLWLGSVIALSTGVLVIQGNADVGYVLGLIAHPMCILFIAGLIVSRVVQRTTPHRVVSWGITLVGFAGLVYDISTHTVGLFLPSSTSGYVLSAVSIASFTCGLIWLEKNKVFRIGAWGRVLGQISYPIYLVHWMMMDLTYGFLQGQRFSTVEHPYVYAALALAASMVGTVILTYGFDRPVQIGIRSARWRLGI